LLDPDERMLAWPTKIIPTGGHNGSATGVGREYQGFASICSTLKYVGQATKK